MSDAACPYAAVADAMAAGYIAYPDVLEVEHLALPSPSAATQQRLRDLGVSQDTLGSSIISIREAPVMFLPQGRFDLVEDFPDLGENLPFPGSGERVFARSGENDGSSSIVAALLVLVRGLDETALDVAAFLLDRPGEVYTLDGRAAVLGEHHLGNPASAFGRPLQVYRDAVEWLRHGGDGIVVVDHLAASRRLLDLDVILEARDRAHARTLDRQTAPPRRTARIVVRRVA